MLFFLKYKLFNKLNIIRIAKYGTASTDTATYIIGGRVDWTSTPWRTSTIAQFKNNEWHNIGDLMEIKSDPSAILYDGEVLIIGGHAEYTTRRLVY